MKPIMESRQANISLTFAIKNGLKQGDALLPLLFNFALEYAISKVQANQEELKLNGNTHRLLVYAYVNILGGSKHTYLLTYLLHGAESFLRS